MEVVWRKRLEHVELFLLDGLEYELLVVRGEEPLACLAPGSIERLGLADRHDVINVRANVEPPHSREPPRRKYSHFKVNLGNFELLVDEMSSVALLCEEFLRG